MRHGKFLATLAAVGIVMVFGLATGLSGGAPAAEQKIRIGIFNSRAVVLAWGRSKTGMEKINKLVAEAKEAKAKGDDKKFQQLDAELKLQQDKMHWQVFSDGNIDDILANIRPRYEEIAKKAGVCVIAEQAVYNDKNVELVDVTDMMAEQFSPDEKTYKMMKDIMKHPPLSFEQMKKHEAKGDL